jgi:CRP/FNR family transcriptional regulator, cyclic AMP receptor protein
MNGIQVFMPGPGRWDHASPSDWADVLAGFPLFAGIPKRRLRKLVRQAAFAEYGPGDMVIQKGSSGSSLHVVLGGSAKVLGKPASRTLRSGDYFGELSLLDGAPRSATVVATSELHVMKLPRKAFVGLVQDPEVSLKMLSTLGSQIRRLELRAGT